MQPNDVSDQSFQAFYRVLRLLPPGERRRVLTYAVILIGLKRAGLPSPSPERFNALPNWLTACLYPVTWVYSWLDTRGSHE